MLDILGLVRALRRPGLLVRAGRFGLDDYRRNTMLKRILKTDDLPRSGAALLMLLDIEAELNEQRLAKSAEYNVTRHITVLTAVMGESRLFEATIRPFAVT